MHEFSNQVKILHSVTPIDLLAQSAVLLVRGLNFRADNRKCRLILIYGAVEKVPQLVGADLHVRPNVSCLHNLNRSAPHNDHFHKSNDKQYYMLEQYITGGHIKLPIDLLLQSAALFCLYNSMEYFFNSPVCLKIKFHVCYK